MSARADLRKSGARRAQPRSPESVAGSSTALWAPDFQALFESAPDLYLVITRDFKIVAASDAYLVATMTKRQEILGRGIFDVFPDNPDDVAATGVSNLRASLQRVFHQGAAHAMAVQKYDIRRPESAGGEFEERYWSPVNSPVFGENGEVIYIIHRVEDVTEFVRLKQLGRERERQTEELRIRAEQMETEIDLRARQLEDFNQQLRRQNERLRQMASDLEVTQELRRSQQLLQAIVDGASSEIYVKDAAGCFLLVNRRFESRLGRSRDDTVGRSHHDVYAPEVAERIHARHRQVLAAGAPIEFEEEVGRGDRQRTYLAVEFPLFDLAGKAYAVCGISTDVTAGRRLEAQFRQSQKMEAIGKLAGGVAHDFNNLLTAILGYSRLVAAGLTARPDLRRHVEQINEAAQRAAALTRQLLAFSRNQPLQPRVVALNAVVAGIEIMLRRLIGEDIELVTTLHPDCGQVLVDPGQLEQVIVNLAVNARDAMVGGGRLCIETANADLDAHHVSQHADASVGPHVLLTVGDSGHGMDVETQSHIFEPFFTTKEAGKGTGLGLSTVYGIVRQSGGHIDVRTEPGHGSLFKIYFPRVATRAANPTPLANVAEEVPRSSETILVVEDDGALRGLVTIYLETAGYSVLCESTAAGVLARAGANAAQISLVLTDVGIPGMSGPQLAAQLTPFWPDTRVLYMSGYSADVVTSRSLVAPGAAFLEKPFTQQELLRKVREVLAPDRS